MTCRAVGAGEQRGARRVAAERGRSCLRGRSRRAGCLQARRAGRRASRRRSPSKCPRGRSAGCGRSRRGCFAARRPEMTGVRRLRGRAVDDGNGGDLRRHRRDGRAAGVSARGLDRAILGYRRRAAHRGRVDRAILSEPQRVDLLERRIEQDECLAGGVDAEDAAGRFGSGEEVARRRKGQRHDVGRARLVEPRALAVGRDLVNHALVAGRGKEVARAIERERPDVLVVGIEEGSRRCRRRSPDRSCRRATWRHRARCSGAGTMA